MTGFSDALAAGLALLAAAAVVDLAAGAKSRGVASLPYLIGAAGSVCLTVGGAGALAGHQARLWPAGVLGSGTVGLVADRLSGLFLVIAFGAAARACPVRTLPAGRTRGSAFPRRTAA
jgi:hypothetical protein